MDCRVYIFRARLVVFVLLIEREAEFAVRVAGARKLRDDFVQIGDGRIDVSLDPLHQGQVIECARIF